MDYYPRTYNPPRQVYYGGAAYPGGGWDGPPPPGLGRETGVIVEGRGSAPKQTGDRVVNKRYRYWGIALCILSAASFGVEIAHLIFTISNWPQCGTDSCKLTYAVPGIWGSIPVFVAGILAIRVVNTNGTLVRIFALFSILSAIIFTPSMIAISVAEIVLRSKECGSSPPYPCYSFNNIDSLKSPKFILPLAVAILAAIEFYLTLMVSIIFCFCWKTTPRNDGTLAVTARDEKTSNVTYGEAEVTSPGAYRPSYSPYGRSYGVDYGGDPSLIRPRLEPYYRSLPPEPRAAEPPPGALPAGTSGNTQIYVVPNSTQSPDAGFQRTSYPVFRPATGSGFGGAFYRNQDYGSGSPYGTRPLPPFSSSMPSLAAFGPAEPNPAYRVIYN